MLVCSGAVLENTRGTTADIFPFNASAPTLRLLTNALISGVLRTKTSYRVTERILLSHLGRQNKEMCWRCCRHVDEYANKKLKGAT